MKPNVNYELWVIMIYQCGFISRNKCAPGLGGVDNGGGQECVEMGVYVYEKFLHLPLNFVVNIKLL